MKIAFYIYTLVILFVAGSINLRSETISKDTIFIRIHFLYGSKPKKKYRYEEDKWFGGLLGGHTGVEYEPNKILNFVPKARFHFFAKRRIINSRFTIHDTASFYGILGGNPDSAKRTIITIPVTVRQKHILDSIALAYTEKSPYDYAFFGMRCGAAAYDVLAQCGVVKKYSFAKTWRKTFYPRKLRRKLEKIYLVQRRKGSVKRVWEKD